MDYEEDIYHPTNTSTLCVEQEQEKEKPTLKKGEHIKKIKTEYGYKKIKIYESLNNGKIRNAKSGLYYDYKVGTKDEDRFFSILVSVGNNNEKSGVLLFYNSPEEYEEHFYVNLNNKIKSSWYSRQIKNIT